jgi:hypothetical protein
MKIHKIILLSLIALAFVFPFSASASGGGWYLPAENINAICGVSINYISVYASAGASGYLVSTACNGGNGYTTFGEHNYFQVPNGTEFLAVETTTNVCNDNSLGYVACNSAISKVATYTINLGTPPPPVVASFTPVPEHGLSDLGSNVSEMFSDLWVLAALAIGIPLGFYIIKKSITLIRK